MDDPRLDCRIDKPRGQALDGQLAIENTCIGTGCSLAPISKREFKHFNRYKPVGRMRWMKSRSDPCAA